MQSPSVRQRSKRAAHWAVLGLAIAALGVGCGDDDDDGGGATASGGEQQQAATNPT